MAKYPTSSATHPLRFPISAGSDEFLACFRGLTAMFHCRDASSRNLFRYSAGASLLGGQSRLLQTQLLLSEKALAVAALQRIARSRSFNCKMAPESDRAGCEVLAWAKPASHIPFSHACPDKHFNKVGLFGNVVFGKHFCLEGFGNCPRINEGEDDRPEHRRDHV